MLACTDQQRYEKKVRANRLPHSGLVQCSITLSYPHHHPLDLESPRSRFRAARCEDGQEEGVKFLRRHGIALDFELFLGISLVVDVIRGAVNTRLASPGAHSRATASTEVESLHSTRWGAQQPTLPKTAIHPRSLPGKPRGLRRVPSHWAWSLGNRIRRESRRSALPRSGAFGRFPLPPGRLSEARNALIYSCFRASGAGFDRARPHSVLNLIAYCMPAIRPAPLPLRRAVIA